jgi:formate hydrogenlyase transcriptional activator
VREGAALRDDRLLTGLCQAIQTGTGLRDIFHQAAEGIHEVTGCGRVILFPAPGPPGGQPGLSMDFTGTPCCREMSPAAAGLSVVQEALRQHQPRIVRRQDLGQAAGDFGHEALLLLPLVCGGHVLGALALAGCGEDDVRRWDQQSLGELAAVLALALDDIAAHARLEEAERARREAAYLRDVARADRDLRLLTGESPAMRAVRLAVQLVARTDSTVLILGETGTGKELVARAIHQLSRRRDRLLVTVNCAALAPGVIASELFGHEQGAFTGAARRRLGRFEVAHQGTIFLDEVGELPPEVQVMLLRVLQERVIERVGGHEPVAVDVRVVAATHRDLAAAITEGRFRADLFYRLNVFPIHVPPLRERREDIPDLVRHFLHHFGRRMSKPVARVGPASLEALQSYHWPGNVRELENLIERAMIVATGDTLEIDPNWLRPAAGSAAVTTARPGLSGLERQAILDALRRCGGRIYGPRGAAAAQGVKPTTLYGKMRKHGIARDRHPS